MDGPAPVEEDFSALSIQDRLSHKNWKARVHAYESLIKAFANSASDSDPVFKPYISNLDLLKKIATDSNAVAQEKGIECLVSLVKFAGETAAKTRETVVPALVDKCFGSARAGTKTQAIELTLQYVEVENGGAGVINDILPGLAAKQPKTVAGTVVALREIIKFYGPTVTPPAPVLKSLPKIFAHSDKTVRAEGTNLVHTFYQYIGPAIEPWLADLKPVQVKELKEAFETMDKDGKGKGSLKPERMTREAARAAEAAGADEGEADAATVEEDLAALDPRASAEPVDIVPKFPANLNTNLASSKWKERKEALDELLVLINATPRIKEAPDYGELTKTLATMIHKDANVNCVIVAAQCLDGLAKGMMGSFARFREIVVPHMMERLKERKANVTDPIQAALDSIFTTTTLADVIPDLVPFFTHKNPQVKEGTLKFLCRALSTSPTPVPPGQIKTLTDPLAVLMEDGFEGARNEAANCLGTLMKMVGERPLNALMDSLADVRKVKVKEAAEKATVKSKAGSGPKPAASKPAAAPAKKPPAAARKAEAAPAPPADEPLMEDEPPKKLGKPPARLLAKKQQQEEAAPASEPPASSQESTEMEPPKKKPPARFLAKKPAAGADGAEGASGGGAAAGAPSAPAVKKLPPAAAGKSAKPPPSAAPGALDTFKYKHTPEDAEALAAELLPASVMTDLGDANWKTRLAALEELTTWASENAAQADAEVVFRALMKKGAAEKNFQVSAKMYGIFCIIAEGSPSFGRSCAALATGHLSEKLGDMKLKKPAGDALTLFAEKTSLQFVLNQAYDPLGKQKAPKVLADAISWIDNAVTEFGIAGLSLRNLVEFLKTGLKNSNATVRTSATKATVTIKLFAGSSIKDLLEDLNPQLLNTIMSEFDKVEGNPAPEPTRASIDVEAMAASNTGKGSKSAGAADALDDLFPRVELDGLLKGTTILADSKSEAWKTKKEALETLQAILDQGANKRLKPAMGEISDVLKARVVDTNKAVQTLALDIVARVATGMGKPFEKYSRLYALPIATVLSDQKAPIRASAIQSLTAIATACEGVDSLVSGFQKALETPNPLQRASLLGWLASWFADHPMSSSLDLRAWSSPIIGCLEDRSGDVRKAATSMLPYLIASCGFDFLMQQTSSLKPASRKTVVPLVEAARGSAPASAAALAAPTPAAPASKTALKPPPISAPPPASTSPPPASPTAAAAPAAASKVAGASKLAGVRRKLPLGTIPRPDSRSEAPEAASAPTTARLPVKSTVGSLRRPSTAFAPASKAGAPAAVPSVSTPFTTMNVDAKRVRLGKDVTKWINEAGTTRKDLADALQHQMEPNASRELVAQLFSHDHNAVNDHIAGLSAMYDFYSAAAAGDDKYGAVDDVQAICLANFDLPLKYVSIKAHEPQSNLVTRCLDMVDAVVSFLRSVNYSLSDPEATCWIPTLTFKLGDAREPVRSRVQQIVQTLPKIYAYSRVFQILLDHGSKSKVAKTRQGALDEMGGLLKRSGMDTCDPAKAFPVIASMIGDKDPAVRKSALTVLSEGYTYIGEKIWSYVGPLSPKDKTQLEERLRRVAGPSTLEKHDPPSAIARLGANGARPASPMTNGRAGLGQVPNSPPAVTSRLAQPGSPVRNVQALASNNRPSSPLRQPRLPTASQHLGSSHGPGASHLPGPSHTGIASPFTSNRPKSILPSRLGPPRAKFAYPGRPAHQPEESRTHEVLHEAYEDEDRPEEEHEPPTPDPQNSDLDETSDITITISSILSNDPNRSVDALKKIQGVLAISPEDGPSSQPYRELAEHTEGLIETITLQMAHVFDRPDELMKDENWRLAKHLIQTLNTFCDHAFLAESLTVNILTSLLEELTLRLLETDDSPTPKIKDLSRFINMIILRLFAKGRRMSIFRALFALLLQIVKPFPANGTLPESTEAKVAELVLKCIWKLARNIPDDLNKLSLDPVELFPAVEHFLQSVPPNEWRARASNKVPCGDMPLRTIKVIIQHVVAHYGDETYDLLSSSFDDPSATIVYPYVYRILNTNSTKSPADLGDKRFDIAQDSRPGSTLSDRPGSPVSSSGASLSHHRSSPGHRTTQSISSFNGSGPFSPHTEEDDPEAQLLAIIGHISSETTGAMHKEGITELHQFLKQYPHKRPRVEKLLESTGPAFRKYINRALASRAAEDEERNAAVAVTLSKLESRANAPGSPQSGHSEPVPHSPRRETSTINQDKLSRLHDIFQYRSSTASNASGGAGSR